MTTMTMMMKTMIIRMIIMMTILTIDNDKYNEDDDHVHPTSYHLL